MLAPHFTATLLPGATLVISLLFFGVQNCMYHLPMFLIYILFFTWVTKLHHVTFYN